MYAVPLRDDLRLLLSCQRQEHRMQLLDDFLGRDEVHDARLFDLGCPGQFDRRFA
jgi:hypothetical protein